MGYSIIALSDIIVLVGYLPNCAVLGKQNNGFADIAVLPSLQGIATDKYASYN